MVMIGIGVYLWREVAMLPLFCAVVFPLSVVVSLLRLVAQSMGDGSVKIYEDDGGQE